MKGIYYLLRFWSWVRIKLLILAILLTVLYCVRMWTQTEFHKGCLQESRTVGLPQRGLDAVVEEEWCGGGLGGGDIGTIKLRDRERWGLETSVFAYSISNEGGPHEPIVVWLSENELEISVDRISSIISQRGKVRGIKITYRIGKVDYP